MANWKWTFSLHNIGHSYVSVFLLLNIDGLLRSHCPVASRSNFVLNKMYAAFKGPCLAVISGIYITKPLVQQI